MTKTQAYRDGLAGLPEPKVKTKHVRELDPIAYVWHEGDVETDASMQNRAAWRKGRKRREVQQWARERNEPSPRIDIGLPPATPNLNETYPLPLNFESTGDDHDTY